MRFPGKGGALSMMEEELRSGADHDTGQHNSESLVADREFEGGGNDKSGQNEKIQKTEAGGTGGADLGQSSKDTWRKNGHGKTTAEREQEAEQERDRDETRGGGSRSIGGIRIENSWESSGLEWRIRGRESGDKRRGFRTDRRWGRAQTTRYNMGERTRNEAKSKFVWKAVPRESVLGFNTLEELCTKEPSEVAVSISSHPGLKTLLSKSVMQPDLIELLCLVLSRAFKSRSDRGTLQHLAAVIKDSGFLRTVLPHYLAGMGSESNAARREQYPQQLENILVILTQVLSIFPASSVLPVSLLLALLPPSIYSLRSSGVDIPAQIEENMEHLQSLVKHLQVRSREGTLRSHKDSYALLPSGADKFNQGEDQQDFRSIPIYPTPEELRHEDRPYLRPNLTSQRYPNTHLYLDTHFRLLREDFVRPLREGIQELLCAQINIGRDDNPGNQVKAKRQDDIRIYHDTKVIAPRCTINGLAYLVQFNVKPLKFVRWQNSKRLIFGSLVCLSCDNFESFLFATVCDRDPKELQEGRVQIMFTEESRNKLATIQENQVFLMVETTAYFEAYRYVLEGLKEQEEDELPFQRYLVDCSPDVQPPAYLQRADTYDLSAVAHPNFKSKMKPFHCLDPQAWPTMEELGLDESQLRAFKLALTKELAIIQGPPGTGKTHVGLKIAQALLTNEDLWRSTTDKAPVLVVCYTNHALDQFLEGIYKFLPKGIVRVGGRSSSDILKQFNLRELAYRDRDAIPPRLSNAHHNIYGELREAELQLQNTSIQLECAVKGILHESVLQQYMSDEHWNSLESVVPNKEDFQVYTGRKKCVIMEWLSLSGLLQTKIEIQKVQKTHDAKTDAVAEVPEESLIDIDELADLEESGRFVDDFIYSRSDKDVHKKGDKERAVKAMEDKMLAVSLDEPETTEESNENSGNKIWELQREQKKKLKNKIKWELRKSLTMTEEEEHLITDIWSLSQPDKWKLYRLWVSRYRNKLRTKALALEQVYVNATDRLTDVKRQQDLCLLKKATVIGMTTTGAAKFRNMLQQARPSLVIVEEAAEVLEAHTITTLSRACQHLILIGDHQQLHPSATVYELAKNFNLEVSMFERLVNMGLPYIRLNYQHRMRPDIARLLTPHIYSELENHPAVLEYDNIKGLHTNLFFVEHRHREEEIKDGRSHQNEHEAQFIVALCQYLLLQEYKPEQITILTTYTGQLHCLRKLMPVSQFSGVKVQVVDKYQGEENDIVLLSLVRSNSQGRVGFLNIPNRVCVALSRAKKALYCIGDSEMLGQVKLWSNIFHTLREKDQIGTALTLCCQNHPTRQVKASSAADFEQAPEGGCTLPCEYRLDCGHVCAKVCHPYDPEHKKYQCLKKCQKILCDLGHCCPLLCYQTCGKCKVLVEKNIPQCQHKQMVPCHQDPATFVCQEPCQKTLECGHPCDTVCGKPCTTSCNVVIHFELRCGHSQQDFCFYKMQKKEPACRTPCEQQLKCGHACRGNCGQCYQGRYHRDCRQKCDRLLICSHKCQAPCTNCPPCTSKCENRCVHSQCSRPCGQPCSPCIEPCAWQCPHQSCTKLCHEPCDRPPCDQPCDKSLNPCGHPCIGLCGEKCPDKCRICDREEVTEIFFGFEDDPEARFIQLKDCGHIIESRRMDQYMEMDEKQQANEEEVAIKLKECPKCRTPIRKNLRYGSHINRSLAEIELVKQMIVGNRKDIQTQALALKLRLKENTSMYVMSDMSDKYFAIENRLMSGSLSLVDLWIIENKINFLTRISKLMKIEKKNLFAVNVQVRKGIEEFLCWLEGRFTEQQVYDLERELCRLTLLAELNAHCRIAQLRRKRHETETDEQTAREVLEKCSQFTEEDEVRAKQIIEDLKKRFPLTGLGISEEDKRMIVSAINMPRPGHWFKCPNGHVYLITECGGATQSAQCPECKATIGGGNHRVARGNQLAPEMDGAQHPAWPTALQPLPD